MRDLPGQSRGSFRGEGEQQPRAPVAVDAGFESEKSGIGRGLIGLIVKGETVFRHDHVFGKSIQQRFGVRKAEQEQVLPLHLRWLYLVFLENGQVWSTEAGKEQPGGAFQPFSVTVGHDRDQRIGAFEGVDIGRELGGMKASEEVHLRVYDQPPGPGCRFEGEYRLQVLDGD